jgi:hypothetical protein
MNAMRAIRVALGEQFGVDPAPVDEVAASMVLAYVARHAPELGRDQIKSVEFIATVLLAAVDKMQKEAAALAPERPLSLRDGVAGVTKRGDPRDFGAAYREEADS